MTEPEPGVQELFDAIALCMPDAVDLDEVVFRSASVQFANAVDFLSGAGAAAFGGRWNPRGIEAAYASLSIQTATNEAFQNILKHGFPASSIRPRVFAGAQVQLHAMLDLTDGNIQKRLGFTLDELLDEDWLGIQEEGDESWTQAAGRGACIIGFEGLIVPSCQHRPDGVNIVIFPKNLRTDSRIYILGEDDLPPHPNATK
jgi:RES domain-containing protein